MKIVKKGSIPDNHCIGARFSCAYCDTQWEIEKTDQQVSVFFTIFYGLKADQYTAIRSPGVADGSRALLRSPCPTCGVVRRLEIPVKPGALHQMS